MPVIGYNLNIPAANNNPSQDQGKMQTNTNAINTLLSLDHFTFADNAAGRHKQVSLPNESAPGIPANTNGVLYANLATGQSWPFWQNALGSFQMLGQQNFATNGYVTIGGLIIQWGKVNGTHGSNNHFNGGDSGTVTFSSSNIAFTSKCFGVQINMLYSTSGGGSTPSTNGFGTVSYDAFTLSSTKFDWFIATPSSDYKSFFWLAVGN